MTDLDFDELDKAVNSLMDQKDQATEANTVSTSSESVAPDDTTDAIPDVPAQGPTAAATSSVARRRGTFMDVVHPSSNMRARPSTAAMPTVISREGVKLTPPIPAATQEIQPPVVVPREVSDTDLTKHNQHDIMYVCMMSEASHGRNRADRYGRKAIAGLATTGALLFGVNADHTSFDTRQSNISTIEQHAAPTPTIVKIGMVAVSDGIDKKYWSSATIQAVTMNELETVRISTGDMWRFQSGGVTNVVASPEGTFKNTGKPCYTVKQLEMIEENVHQHNKQHTQNENVLRRMNEFPAARDTTLTYINTDLACNAESAGGWATGDRNNARAYFDIPVMST